MAETTGQETIACAFCGGKGSDPYNQLSSRSRCEVCKGQGLVQAPAVRQTCPFCTGTGSFKTFSCPVCRGKGVVPLLPEPTKVCPFCEGRAFAPSSGLECLECHGRGRVTQSPKR